MTKIEYRGFEITADQAGYGYIATPPEYDLGMPVLHGWNIDEAKAEIDGFIEDGEDAPIDAMLASPAPVAADIQLILDRITADAAEHNRLAAADKARETTVSVEFNRDNGIHYSMSLTGIAPFTAQRINGSWTGAAGWTVLGQPQASKGGKPFARMTAIEHGGPFAGLHIAFPLLTEAEARRLAAQIASLPAIQQIKVAA